MSKTDDIAFRGGANFQQDFIKLILNLTEIESHSQL